MPKEGLADGTLGRPEEAMDLALGLLLPALEACLGACGAIGWFLRDGSGLGVAVACAGSRPWDACWLRRPGERHSGPP